MAINNRVPIKSDESNTESDNKSNKPSEPREIAWKTYKDHEEIWLEQHPNEYAWIVGEQAYFFKNVKEMQKAILESDEEQDGITIKLIKTNERVYEVHTPFTD